MKRRYANSAKKSASRPRFFGFNDHVESIARDDRGVRAHYVIASFVARWNAGEARPSEEADRVAWIDPATLGDLPTTPGLAGILARATALFETYR